MAEQQNQNTKKRPWLKWVLIFTIPLVLIAGGLGFYFSGILNQNNNGEINMRNIQTLTIESFPINLADQGHRRYLRTQITMEYVDKRLASELELKGHRIKDTIINVLRSKTVNDLNTTEKSEALRQELMDEINELLNEGKIIGLYFEEFIIQ